MFDSGILPDIPITRRLGRFGTILRAESAAPGWQSSRRSGTWRGTRAKVNLALRGILLWTGPDFCGGDPIDFIDRDRTGAGLTGTAELR